VTLFQQNTVTTYIIKITKRKFMTDPKKIKIIYYYDALCGWCFGMYPVIAKLQKKYQNKIEFEVISGGLFLNEHAGKVNKAAPHIKKGAYKVVEEKTGVKFGAAFLNDLFGEQKNTLNSLFPAIALCIVKERFPDKALAFSTSLTRAIYEDGIDSIDINSYTKYATKLGFEEDEFQEKMRDKRYQSMAQKDFKAYINSGIRGFPTLLIESDKGATILTQGQSNFSTMEQRLAQHLA
jgi:putative protein-disulfide isomerase